MFTREKLEQIFNYHTLNAEQAAQVGRIRDAAHSLAKVIVENTPPCADQTAAIRLVREAMMMANVAVALDGLV